MDDITTRLPSGNARGDTGSDADRIDGMLRDLEAYWQELSRTSVIPFRSDVDPKRIDAALPNAFVLQRVAKGVGRFRVAGGQIEAMLGMDPRGMPLTALFTPSGRTSLQHWLSEVFDRPAIVEIPVVSSWGLGRPRLTGKLLILPLAAEDGAVTMAMGALITDAEIGRAPRRFDVPDGEIRIEEVRHRPESARRVVKEPRRLADIVPPVDLGAPDPAPHITARAQRNRRAPGERFLTLVVDNT